MTLLLLLLMLYLPTGGSIAKSGNRK